MRTQTIESLADDAADIEERAQYGAAPLAFAFEYKRNPTFAAHADALWAAFRAGVFQRKARWNAIDEVPSALALFDETERAYQKIVRDVKELYVVTADA